MTYAAPLPFVDDRLPDRLPIDRSESEWLLTLLSAEELQYIFEGQAGNQGPERRSHHHQGSIN